jgi:hypothetical protein
MFIQTMTKEDLVARLGRVQKRICCYTRQPCDCKYGANMSGEQTGCPEVSMVMELFKNMTKAEYKQLFKQKRPKKRKKIDKLAQINVPRLVRNALEEIELLERARRKRGATVCQTPVNLAIAALFSAIKNEQDLLDVMYAAYILADDVWLTASARECRKGG